MTYRANTPPNPPNPPTKTNPVDTGGGGTEAIVLSESFHRKFIQIVVGPRQTGKTTAVTQALEILNKPHRFVTADNPNLASTAWLENEWQLQKAGNTVTLAHYLDLLGQASMLTGLQNYSMSQIRTRKSSPRFMVFDTALLTYATGTGRRRLLDNSADKGRLVESAVGAYLLARSREDDFEVYWWRDRDKEVDFVIKKDSRLTAIEVKSGRVKHVGGSLEFKKLYPEALSLVVGSTNLSLEDFLLGKQRLFL